MVADEDLKQLLTELRDGQRELVALQRAAEERGVRFEARYQHQRRRSTVFVYVVVPLMLAYLVYMTWFHERHPEWTPPPAAQSHN